MAKDIQFLKKCIMDVLTEYKEHLSGSNLPNVEFELMTDEQHNRYQLIALGWEGKSRIFNIYFHLEIRGDKIWVQEDTSEDGIANLLFEKGVSKKEIVLAYFPDFHRKYTEFAVE